MTHTPPDVRTVLRTGLEWLLSEQPEGAMVSHHGLILYADNDRAYSFLPEGADGLPVVCVDIIDPARQANHAPAEVLGQSEMDELVAMVRSLGFPVATTWGGSGSVTGSLRLEDPAHPSLVAAMKLHNKGCTEHPDRNPGCTCGWDKEGKGLLKVPHANLMKRPLPRRKRIAYVPQQRAEEPVLPADAVTPAAPEATAQEFAAPTPSLLRRIRSGLRKMLAVPEPEAQVTAKYKCPRCGFKANFQAPHLSTYEADLVRIWRSHKCDPGAKKSRGQGA